MKRATTMITACTTLCCLVTPPAEAGNEIAPLALTAPGPSMSAMPDHAELRKRGAIIGRVDIRIEDVFEGDASLAAPYRLANALHASTKLRTVADQLLFRTGDSYDPRIMEESARQLRGQQYLNEATIEPVRYNDDNTVDVLVRVHDVWTLSPGFSFGRKGGANSANIQFEDTNFLGLGKQIGVERSSSVERDMWRFAYYDPQLLGSRWRLSTAHADMSDGNENTLSLTRPFYSLDSRWSVNIAGTDSTATQSQYALGQIVNEFQMQQSTFDLGGGWSRGQRDGWTRRYLAGFRFLERSFAPLHDDSADAIANVVPDDRTVSYPWLGIEIVEDRYRKTRNLDQIGRTEDLYLGTKARFDIGYASTAFGSTNDALMFAGSAQAGFEPVGEQFIIGAMDVHGRLERGGLRNTVLNLGSRYYVRQSPRRVLYAAAAVSFASQLDPEEQLLLGGDNGLRGYPLRYQAGTSRALLTLEERFYTDWQPLKLFNVGAAVFFDAGRTWGSDPYAVASGSGRPLGWLRDVGVGLRLGSARSGLGNVLHVDVAMPLDGGNDIESVQLLIESSRSF